MKIYLASGDLENHVSAYLKAKQYNLRLRLLLSYWYFKHVDLDALFAQSFVPPYPEVFADSGAFSAMTQGVTIHLPKYAEWVQKYKHLFTLYANLDVIKNADATWHNQQRLEREYGLSPLPVFHVSEPWEMLERYLARYPYLALGVAGTRSSVYMSWLIQCFKRAQGRAVYHGFGITDWKVMASFPWYSADSSTWNVGARFAEIVVFDERQTKPIRVRLGDQTNCYRYAPCIRSCGFDPAHFADRRHNNRDEIATLSQVTYMKAEQWLEKRWGKIEIPQRSVA